MDESRTISAGTIVVAVAGALSMLAIFALSRSGIAGPDGAATVVAVGTLIVILWVEGLVTRTILSFAPGERIRRQWILFGLALGCFAVGQIIFSIQSIASPTAPPFPGPADIFYVLAYLLFGIGLASAAWAFLRALAIRWPAVLVAAITGALCVVLYVTLLHEVLLDPNRSLLAKALNFYYPLADVVLLLGPTMILALTLARGRLGLPYWPLIAGIAFVAVADVSYAWLKTRGLYAPGGIVDYGWIAGVVLLGVSASLMRDVAATPVRSRRAGSRAA